MPAAPHTVPCTQKDAVLLDDWLLSRDSQHRSHKQNSSAEALFKILAVVKRGRQIVEELIEECFENRAALYRPIFTSPCRCRELRPMDPWCAPQWVLAAHASNQVPDLAINLWPTTAPSGFPMPIGAEATPVPANHRFGLITVIALRSAGKSRYSQTRSTLSTFRSRTREGDLRPRISTCRRRTSISACSLA